MDYAKQIGRTARQCSWCPEMVVPSPYKPGAYLRAKDGIQHEDSWAITKQFLPTPMGCRECGVVFRESVPFHSCEKPIPPIHPGGPPPLVQEAPPVSARIELTLEDLIQ